ncbi:hypothetical protein EQ500_08410, partial [Lactobacillus sp. XV13L]|nr:hypothetical protein [Lactobacillus sp. XV13L]
MNGKTWYQVSTNEWISADYISFDKDGDKKPEDHTISKVRGQGTIKNEEGGQIYDSPWSDHKATRKLPNGTQWIIGGEVTNGADGKTWYQVSTNEWICSDDFDFSGKTDVDPKPSNSGSDSDDSGNDDDSTNDDTDQYIFEPFFYQNSNSVSQWGLRMGPDITNDQIKDPDSMRSYADKVMQLDPIVQLSVLENTHDEAEIGDTNFLNADPIGVRTMITVNGIVGNPFRIDSPMQLTLDNSMTAKHNVNYSMSDSVNLAHRNNNLLRKTV